MTDKKDRAEEARELARVEAAAAAAMGLPPPAPADAPSSSKPKATASASTSSAAPDPFANYSTAAQLGYRDEAAERAAEEAGKEADEAELRKSEGTIGQWQKVAKPGPVAPPAWATQGKGKGRAEEGFVGAAVLGSAAAAAAAAGIKREQGDGADIKPDPDVKPAPLAGQDDADDDPSTSTAATKKRRAFLAEKSAIPDDDDDALSDGGAPALGPIKLKKRRLTVKEQAAEAAALEAAEREVREREEQRAARAKEGRKAGQWESVEVGAEGEAALLEFEPLPPVVGEAQEGGEAGAVEDREQDKPKVAPSAFKKRKMPGAAARRK
ncbi:uncharacterized protein RHOBADRAFT_66242 [Rhodotorula graminis WP1]|uniref:Uncharacterized protein n=1 Tax=Rhodotorula graminis (strain WP1) TaxID=578459 RepID=A0A194SB56_RHOGW|nr:uncharacterized protein RHOBADRAFT_66242 [Rhodotorula graminis WP1]KPV76636.1 hypothetical protein RHOBADRAFT_66242 [Rhodotorula graminis WP1]